MNRARRTLDEHATEADFQRTVVDLAGYCRWSVMHVRAVSDHNGRTRTPTTIAGWPDLVLWRPGRFVAAELKSQRGRLTTDQRSVLDSLRAAGVDVRVWRPSDWPEVEATLTGQRKLLEVW